MRWIFMRSIARCLLALAPVLASPLAAQDSGFGKSETGIPFDPLQAPPAPLEPEFPERRLIPEHPVRPGVPSRFTPRAPRPGPPVLQYLRGDTSQPANTAPALASTASRSWESVVDTNFSPGDPDLAAGPEDVIAVVNSLIVRHNKSGQITHSTTLNQWFSAFLPRLCPFGTRNCLLFDPMISYDQIHGRFLIVAVSLDFVSLRSHWLLSASRGATYSSGWTNWVMNAATNAGAPTPIFIDYPKMGYDGQAIYLTGNAFNYASQYVYSKLRVIPKTQLYGLNPATELTFWETWGLRNRNGIEASTLYPPRLRGRTAADYSSYYIVNTLDDSNFLTLWKVVNPTGPNPTLQQIQIDGLLFYSKPPRVPQMQWPVTLDIGDSGVQKAILRDGYLYVTFNAAFSDEPITVTYVRVDTRSQRLLAQTRWTGGNFFYPAFDVPASLNPLAHFPNILPVGTNTRHGQLVPLTFLGVKDGEVPYFDDRWGDYFGGAIDPQEGGLWVYGSFAKLFGGLSRWGTWAAYYPPVTTQRFEDVPPDHIFFNSINITSQWGVSTPCGTSSTRFCPEDTVTRGVMAELVIRSLMDENFAFPSAPYFTDVPSAHPRFKYIQKLRELGLTSGCAPNLFCVDDPVTRGQAAVFLIRAKMRPLFGDEFAFPITPYFSDVPPEHMFFRFIQKLRELGVTTGCAEGVFCADAPLTRGQASRFLERAFLN